MLIKAKALSIYQSLEKKGALDVVTLNGPSFTASDGWIDNVLKRNKMYGVTLHGEANDLSDEEKEKLACQCRQEIQNLVDEYEIPLSRFVNADQTGVFFATVRSVEHILTIRCVICANI